MRLDVLKAQLPRAGAFHDGVTNIILASEPWRVDLMENTCKVPYGRAKAHTGVVLITAFDFVFAIQFCQFPDLLLEHLQIGFDILVRIVVDPAHPVTSNTQAGSGFEDRCGVRVVRVRDSGCDHTNLLARSLHRLHSKRKIRRYAAWFHMTARSYREVNTVEAAFRSKLRHVVVVEPLQVFGEYMDVALAACLCLNTPWQADG